MKFLIPSKNAKKVSVNCELWSDQVDDRTVSSLFLTEQLKSIAFITDI